MRGEQKAASAGSRVADGLTGLRAHDFDEGTNERARREVLACAALGVFGVLLQQAFVDFAFDVYVQRLPRLAVNERDEAAQFGGVLNLVLRLAKDDAGQ